MRRYENDLIEFKSILEELVENDSKYHKRIRLTEEERDNFTLMQHCCRNEGLEEFLNALLGANVSPNKVQKDNDKHCIILAAEIANEKVIESLIRYNQPTFDEEEHTPTQNSSYIRMESKIGNRSLKSSISSKNL